jgi:hypothetical protein
MAGVPTTPPFIDGGFLFSACESWSFSTSTTDRKLIAVLEPFL